MKTATRLIVILLATVAGLMALVALAAWLIGWEWLRGPVENRASAALNRTEMIDGAFDVRWDWDLSPRLVLGDIHAGPAGWESTSEPLAHIDRLAADVAIWPLLFGRLRLNDVRAEGSSLRLHQDASGEANDDGPNPGTIGGPVTVGGTLRDPAIGLGGVVLGAALSPAAALLATLKVDPSDAGACQATAELAEAD
ncbi:AsmA family protein [Hyphobacterium sp.]|uniref:AsmA family protein n=1 Tax=Hyphobacterium sp. TaxID=2004662 RepID=UPI003B51C53F